MATSRSEAKGINMLREYLTLARIQTAAVMATAPIWGALAIYPQIGWGWLAALFVIGLSAHIYGFVLNEVVDVEVDAQAAALREKPLVRESIRRSRALVIALSQIPLMIFLGILFFGANGLSLTFLSLFILLASVYDLRGKRFPISPILGDIVLGVSVGLLCLYGAAVAPLKFEGQLSLAASPLAFVLAGLATLQVIFNNGVEGGIKDLDHDFICGACTTANWLGANLTGTNGLVIPWALKLYSLGSKGLLPLVLALALSLHWLPYRGWELAITIVALIGLNILIFATLVRFLPSQSVFDREKLKRLFSYHEILTYAAAPVLLWFYIGTGRASVLLLLPIIWFIGCNLVLYGKPLQPRV